MSSSSASGVASHPKVCRSTRPSPAKKPSRMVQSPADSRGAVRREDEASDSDISVCPAPSSGKRKRQEPTTDDESSDQTNTPQPRRRPNQYKNPRKSFSKTQSNRQSKSDRSQKATQESENASLSKSVSLQINLVQDSDEENEKVSMKQKKVPQFDNIREYYDEMISIVNVSVSSILFMFPLPNTQRVQLIGKFDWIIIVKRSSRHSVSVQVVWRRSVLFSDVSNQSTSPSRWIPAVR